jgi:transformation/transcription domain-associated protein
MAFSDVIGPSQRQQSASPATPQPAPRKPWEYVEEILRTLRTAYPLLVVSMEGIVDSINTRFKCPWDEDSYRLIVALLNDGISVCSLLVNADCQYMGKQVPLPHSAKVNIRRFAESRLPKSIKVEES